MEIPQTHDIAPGMLVWSIDQARIGKVVQVWRARRGLAQAQPKDVGYVEVQREGDVFDQLIFVPLEAVYYVHPEGVYLSVRADEVDERGWAVRASAREM